MQVEELFDLTSWIENEIITKGVLQSYTALFTILNNNAQPSATQQSLEEQKDILFDILKDVQLSLLSSGQLEVLDEIGLLTLVGVDGVEELEQLLYKNVLDIATTVNKLSSKLSTIQTAIDWSKSTRTVLTKIITLEEVTDLNHEALLRVHFQKEAHLANLTEFKDWGKSWFQIGRGIAMAHDAAPEDFRVIGASKGSIILTLATSYGIAKTTSFIILKVLEVIERVYGIKKMAEEVRHLKLGNDKALIALEKDAEDVINTGKAEILSATIQQLGLNSVEDGEKISVLDTSIKQLVDFIEKGGEVDFLVPDEYEEEVSTEDANVRTREELRVIFKEVRQIEKKLNLLGFKSNE